MAAKRTTEQRKEAEKEVMFIRIMSGWSLFQGKEYECNSGMLTLRGEMWEWAT